MKERCSACLRAACSASAMVTRRLRATLARLDGLGIHFLHIHSPHADALPVFVAQLRHGRRSKPTAGTDHAAKRPA
ncbi:hypothetical protein ACFQY4_26530 [Catellatospora bangladeshensis]|uniref:Uncharacterized protein n=1 Tax=Catellatospora bangladeshensis TaxID=310355 RepID=A0A8J3NPF4_9ACTN|nr:hypothetical protein [Catellatospora bangladeshensis]GIF85880.1 hypothetical protein Cba03nite_72290 [Catellatospora bangladeshensis]